MGISALALWIYIGYRSFYGSPTSNTRMGHYAYRYGCHSLGIAQKNYRQFVILFFTSFFSLDMYRRRV